MDMSTLGFDDAENVDYFGDVSSDDYFDGEAAEFEPERYIEDGEATVVRDHRTNPYYRSNVYGRYPYVRYPYGRYRPYVGGQMYGSLLARRRAQALRAAAARGARQRALAGRRAPIARARQDMGPPRAGALSPGTGDFREASPPVGATGDAQAAEIGRTRAAVQELGLETEARTDALAGAVTSQGNQIQRAGMALGATAVADALRSQLESSLPGLARNPLVELALQTSPLFLLKSDTRKEGVMGFLSQPQVWGTGLAAGVTLAGFLNSKFQSAERIQITRFATHLPLNGSLTFAAQALDSSGAVLAKKIVWSAETTGGIPTTRLTVDADTGLVTAKNTGDFVVVATIDGTTITDKVPLKVA
jgi:hypothetical protein